MGTMQKQDIIQVVIIGSGFGGIYSYRSLIKAFGKKVRCIIISKTNHFLFTPMLHEAATLGVSDSHLIELVDNIIRNCDSFVQDNVELIDLEQKFVKTGPKKISFDYLIIAAGAQTNYHNVPGAKKFAYGLKTYADLLEIRNRIVFQFKSATTSSPSHNLHFVIAGGGGTGVEMAAELSEVINTTFESHFGKPITNKALVTIVHKGKQLLQDFHPGLRETALNVLTEKGIDVMLGRRITKVSDTEVMLDNGEILHTGTVIWTAGIKPVAIKTLQKIKKSAGGHIFINESLQLLDYPYVFAIGDIARSSDFATMLPARAQVASRQGNALGEIIKQFHSKNILLPFNYKSLGELISVGEWYGIGTILGQNIIGRIAWYIRRTVYLLKMISFYKKLRVSYDWTLRIFYRGGLPNED